MRRLLVPALVASLALAGCFGAQALPDERTFTASDGKVSAGWAYDGVGLAAGQARLSGTVNNPQNTGLVEVTFTHQGSEFVVVFDQFVQADGKDFQDGGVAFDLLEHGDTGVADASIPRILATVAAWGSASVVKDGLPLAAAPWTAHLMISRDTVRGSDGRIANAAGSGPYDPANPSDARIVENDPQALFFVKHPMGETYARGATTESTSASVQGQAQDATVAEILAEKGAHVVLNYTVSGAAAPVAVGQVSLRVLNAAGEEVARLAPTPVAPNAQVAGSFDIPADVVDGALTVKVDGLGFYAVGIESTVSYQDTPFLVVTWDDVVLS